ncbi:FecCD family ABC transporter permease [Pseudonocardia nigra]|uniref:FecCD family ABC transporter permease n=1 Tax=Pseudonocardia nigra TaxID=1921578 RepID=UPI001C6011C0|nr:iron chelate uptake ABC transporter family permease subunit [Pseudonocardia nigra]
MTSVLAPPAPRPRVRRRAAPLALALAGLAGAALLSLLVGNQPLRFGELLAALTDFAGRDSDLIVWHLRIPRTVAGLLAGVALGLAGAVAQGLTRNPLADPGLLGVNAGAALGVVVAIAVLGVGTLAGYAWFAFAGAAAAAVAVHAVASAGRGGATPVKLALAGAALSALLGSVTSAFTLLDVDAFERFRFWVIGSLARADLATVGQAVPFVAAGAVLALALGRALDAVALGDDTASALGAGLHRVRGLGVAAVVVLSGTATAVAGPIGFVGLTAPHLARAIAGADHRWVLPWSAVLAPTVLLLADVAGRVVLRPEEVQIGVTAAVLGAPVFLYLVRRRKLPQL